MLSAFSETLHCMFPYLRKTVKICSIYNNIINTQSFILFFETHDHHFSV